MGTDWEEGREEELCPSCFGQERGVARAHGPNRQRRKHGRPQTLGGHVAITTETALPTSHLAFANFEDASAFGSDVGRKGGRKWISPPAHAVLEPNLG